MRQSLLERFRAFCSDCRGTSVIEFALFAPILAVTMMGVTDVAMAYTRKIALEQAAFRALENVSVAGTRANYDYLKADAAAFDGTGGVLPTDVTVNVYLECNNVRQAATVLICPVNQLTSKYVEVSIASTYTPMFIQGPLAATGNSNGVINLNATALVRAK